MKDKMIAWKKKESSVGNRGAGKEECGGQSMRQELKILEEVLGE